MQPLAPQGEGNTKGICDLLTPMDIHNKEFKRSFRGYNEGEIDDFLDQVVNDYEKLFRDNENLRDQVARNERDIEQYHRLEQNLHDTLLVAQRTAEEVTSAAKKTAAELRDNTEKACQNMKSRSEMDAKQRVEEAEQQARNMLDEAKRAARQRIEAADEKVRAMMAEYDRLAREKGRFLLKLRTAMESELSVLNHVIGTLPRPEEDAIGASSVPKRKTSDGSAVASKAAETAVDIEKKSGEPGEGDADKKIASDSEKPDTVNKNRTDSAEKSDAPKESGVDAGHAAESDNCKKSDTDSEEAPTVAESTDKSENAATPAKIGDGSDVADPAAEPDEGDSGKKIGHDSESDTLVFAKPKADSGEEGSSAKENA